MNNNNDPYYAVQRNTGLAPRKMSSHNDAYSLHIFKTDTEQALNFIGQAVVGFVYVWFMFSIGFAFLWWLDVIKL
jgi:hypothetical protein